MCLLKRLGLSKVKEKVPSAGVNGVLVCKALKVVLSITAHRGAEAQALQTRKAVFLLFIIPYLIAHIKQIQDYILIDWACKTKKMKNN